MLLIFFFLFLSLSHVCVNLVGAASHWEKVIRRGDMLNLLNSEYLICGTVDNSSRLSGEVLCSCDSISLLAVDLLVAAYIKHGIQQRNTPSTE